MRHSPLFGTIADNYDKERHRIDVDCRRTDRTQPLFIASSSSPSTPDGTPGPSQPTHRSKFSPANGEIGAQSQTNEHVEKLCEILLTYGLYEKKLGKRHFYVLEARMNIPIWVVMLLLQLISSSPSGCDSYMERNAMKDMCKA